MKYKLKNLSKILLLIILTKVLLEHYLVGWKDVDFFSVFAYVTFLYTYIKTCWVFMFTKNKMVILESVLVTLFAVGGSWFISYSLGIDLYQLLSLLSAGYLGFGRKSTLLYAENFFLNKKSTSAKRKPKNLEANNGN